jgi:hypothetical protein
MAMKDEQPGEGKQTVKFYVIHKVTKKHSKILTAICLDNVT